MAVELLNIEGLEALDRQAPVVMVNLMRFHERSLDGDGSGWDAYLRYSAHTVPMIKARGGTLLWTGNAKAVALGQQAGNQWDYLALVYYPSVAAFIDMMTSHDYETQSDPHRRNGCAEHLIIATSEAYSKFKVLGVAGASRFRAPRTLVLTGFSRAANACSGRCVIRITPCLAGHERISAKARPWRIATAKSAGAKIETMETNNGWPISPLGRRLCQHRFR